MKHLSRIPWRGILARLPLPMLALAASYGVYSYALLFVPPWVAIIQAAAFECTYIGLAVTQTLDQAGRRRATAISLGAVTASITYNTLAGWFHAQPAMLSGATDIAWLCLAVLHGAPLAWVAFLVASLLLHQQDDARAQLAQRQADIAQLTADLAQSQATAAQLTADLAQLRAAAAQPDPLLAQQAQEIAQLNAQVAQQEQTAAQQARTHANSAREADRQIAQLQELAAQPLAIDGIDLLAIARRLRSGGVSSRETAQLIGLPESTLRSRLDKAAQNGHAVEAE